MMLQLPSLIKDNFELGKRMTRFPFSFRFPEDMMFRVLQGMMIWFFSWYGRLLLHRIRNIEGRFATKH